MGEKDNFNIAIELLHQGKMDKAKQILIDLEKSVKDKGQRLKIIDPLVNLLSPIEDHEKLIELCKEAEAISSEISKKDLQAYFMGRHAEFLNTHSSFVIHRMRELRLSPGWFQFSTESNKNEYEALSKYTEDTYKLIEKMFIDALNLAKESGNKVAIGRLLMSQASVTSSEFINHKMLAMQSRLQASLWLKFRFLRHPFFENLIILNRANAKISNDYRKKFTQNYLEAASIFKNLNDPTEGYAYFNLALGLRLASSFRSARVNLTKARIIAEKYNDILLKEKVDDLEKSLKIIPQ